MMLGDEECDDDTKYFLKHGFYPIRKHYHFRGKNKTTSEFDTLNYLECNYNTYFENPRCSVWGF